MFTSGFSFTCNFSANVLLSKGFISKDLTEFGASWTHRETVVAVLKVAILLISEVMANAGLRAVDGALRLGLYLERPKAIQFDDADWLNYVLFCLATGEPLANNSGMWGWAKSAPRKTSASPKWTLNMSVNQSRLQSRSTGGAWVASGGALPFVKYFNAKKGGGLSWMLNANKWSLTTSAMS